MARTLLGESLSSEQRRLRAIQIARQIESAVNSRTESTVLLVQSDLERLRIEIIGLLAQQPPSWQVTQLNALLNEVRAAVDRWKAGVASTVAQGTLANADDGSSLPGAIAIGLGSEDIGMIASEYAQPSIDDDVVAIAYASSAYMVEDVGGMLQTQVDSLVRRMALAGMTPYDAIQALTPSATVRRGMPFSSAGQRAETIIRTEMGRVFSQATDASMTAAQNYLPGMKQQWIATDDERTRPSHRAAHEQIVAMGEPFEVGGESLRYPRDPDASPDETINCRCVAIPYADEWAYDEGPMDEVMQDGEYMPAIYGAAAGDWGIDLPYVVADPSSLSPNVDMQNVRGSIDNLVSALQATSLKDAVDPLKQLENPAATVREDKDESRSLGFLRHVLESDGTPEGRRAAADKWLKQELEYATSTGNDHTKILQILRLETAYLDVGIASAQRDAGNLLAGLMTPTRAGGVAIRGFSAKDEASGKKFYDVKDTVAAAGDPNIFGSWETWHLGQRSELIDGALADNARRSELITKLAKGASVDPYGGSPTRISNVYETGIIGTDWLRFLATLPDEAILGVHEVGEGRTSQYSSSSNSPSRLEKSSLMPAYLGETGREWGLITTDEWRARMLVAANGIDAMRTLKTEASAVGHVAWATQAMQGVINVGVRREDPISIGGMGASAPSTVIVGGSRRPDQPANASEIEKALHTIERVLLKDGRILPTTWSGKAVAAPLRGASGEHNWEGLITIDEDTWAAVQSPSPEGSRAAMKTLIHEMVHGARSTATDREFAEALGIEEGLTELRSQIIASPLVAKHVEGSFIDGTAKDKPMSRAFGIIPGGESAKGIVPLITVSAKVAALIDNPPRGVTTGQWAEIATDGASKWGSFMGDVLGAGKRKGMDVDWGNYLSVGSSAPSYATAMKEWFGHILGSDTWWTRPDASKVFGSRVSTSIKDLLSVIDGGTALSDKYKSGKDFEFWYRDAIDHGVQSSKSAVSDTWLATEIPPAPGKREGQVPPVGTVPWYERVIEESGKSDPDATSKRAQTWSPNAQDAVLRSIEEEAKAIRYHIVRQAATELLADGGISPQTTAAYSLLEQSAWNASNAASKAATVQDGIYTKFAEPAEVAKSVTAAWKWGREADTDDGFEPNPGGGWAQRGADSALAAGKQLWGEYAVGDSAENATDRMLKDRPMMHRGDARELLAETWTSIAYPLIAGTHGTGTGAILGLPIISDRPQFKHALRMFTEKSHPTGSNTYTVKADGSITIADWEVRQIRLWADGISGMTMPSVTPKIEKNLNVSSLPRVLDGPAQIERSSYAYHRAMLLQVWAMGKRMGMIDVPFPDWISETKSGMTSYAERSDQIRAITTEAMTATEKKVKGAPIGAETLKIAADVDPKRSGWAKESIIDKRSHAKYQEVLKPLIDAGKAALDAGILKEDIAFHLPTSLADPVSTSTRGGTQAVGVDAKGNPVIPVLKGRPPSITKMDWYFWRDQELRPVSTWSDVVTPDKIDNLRVRTIGERQFQVGGNLNWLPLGASQDTMTFRDKYGQFLIGPWDLLDYNEATWANKELLDEVERRRLILQTMIEQRKGTP